MANPFPDEDFEDDLDRAEEEVGELSESVVMTTADDEAEPRENRRDRRQRFRDEKRQERDDDGMRSSLEELRRQNAELTGRLNQMQMSQRPPQDPQQPFAQINGRIASLRQQMESVTVEHQALVSSKAPADQVRKVEDRFHDLNEEYHEAITQRSLMKLAPPPQDPATLAAQQRLQMLHMSNPDVMGNNHARALAEAELKRMSKGRSDWQPSDEDYNRAFDVARQELKLGRYADLDPSEHQRRATSGYPTGRSPSADRTARNLTEDEVKQARWWYDEVIGGEATDREKIARYKKDVLSQPS